MVTLTRRSAITLLTPHATVYREGHRGIPRVPSVGRVARSREAAVPIRADDHAPARRWRHGQIEEPRAGPRMHTSVASGVQILRKLMHPAVGGAPSEPFIDDAEVEAARRFYEDYVHGIEGVRQETNVLVLRSGSGDAHDGAIARAMAVGRHRDVAELLGTRMTGWLTAFLVEELSFTAMAARYWPGAEGRKAMTGAMATMLLLLSKLYAALDRRKKRRSIDGQEGRRELIRP